MAMSTDDAGLTGRMLIATPVIGDPRFERTVILVCAHSTEHAMGIIVNRSLGSLRLPALLEQLGVEIRVPAPDQPVLSGGPVEQDRGFVLHSTDYHCDDATLDVGAGVALTATKDVLEAIASARRPSEAVLALGYAGWGPGQLEGEIQANAWLTCEADNALIFGDALEDKWAAALGTIGVTPDKLSSLAGSA